MPPKTILKIHHINANARLTLYQMHPSSMSRFEIWIVNEKSSMMIDGWVSESEARDYFDLMAKVIG